MNQNDCENKNLSLFEIGLIYRVYCLNGHSFAAKLVAIRGNLLFFENRTGFKSGIHVSQIGTLTPAKTQPKRAPEDREDAGEEVV